MRLLVTRPMPDAAETAAELEARGHTVIVDPVTKIENLSPPDLTIKPEAIVLTSRNAARALAEWPTVSALHQVPVFTVGKATAELARAVGFTEVSAGAGDVERLADDLAATLDPQAGKILYIAGRDRAGDLDGRLTARGIAVVMVEAYAAVAVDGLGRRSREALATGALEGALFFSRRSATIFGDLVTKAGLAEALHDVMVYAISNAAGEPMRRFSPAGMRIASYPDGESLLATIGR